MGAKDKNLSEIGKALFHCFIHEKDLSSNPIQILGTFISGHVKGVWNCQKIDPFRIHQKKRKNLVKHDSNGK
jgi:hypothetical protein